MNSHDGSLRDRVQTVAHRLSARLSAGNNTLRLVQFEFLRNSLKPRRIFGGQHRNYFVYLFAAFELSERVNDYRNAAQFEKLFRAIAAQPRSFAGSHDYGDVHSL